MAYGTTIGDILYSWADFGVFAYLLPFLMIFAIIYGILSKTKLLGKNKGVNATIALAAGLLSLQFEYVSNFYATIFPYTGMAIGVLLAALILMGLMGEEISWTKYVWFGIGAVSFIFVLIYSFADWSWYGVGGYSMQDSIPAFVALGLLLFLMGFIIWGGKD
jgi:hypothetical protein